MPKNRSAPTYIIRVKPEGAASAQRVDVSDRVTALSYEDNEKSVDKLHLTVDNRLYQNFGDPIFTDGTILEFSFGYADGVMSPPREAVIVKITGGAVLKIEAHGKAFLLNTERKCRTFKDMSRSDVAKQIAKENGFTSDDVLFIEDTLETIPVIMQTRFTDAMLLRDMANREGWEWFIDYRGFHFAPRDLTKAPAREFTYFVDTKDGDILEPPNVENDLTAKPGGINAKGIDPKTKKPIDVGTDNEDDKGRAGLGSFVKINKASGERGPRTKRVGQSTMLTTSEKNEKNADKHVNGAFRKIQLSAVKLTFPAIGDPLTEAKSIIKVNGIGALSQRYHITQVKHDLGKDYRMTIHCCSDGLGAPGPVPVKSKATVNQQDAPPGGTSDSELQRQRSVDKRSGATKDTFRPKGGAKK